MWWIGSGRWRKSAPLRHRHLFTHINRQTQKITQIYPYVLLVNYHVIKISAFQTTRLKRCPNKSMYCPRWCDEDLKIVFSGWCFDEMEFEEISLIELFHEDSRKRMQFFNLMNHSYPVNLQGDLWPQGYCGSVLKDDRYREITQECRCSFAVSQDVNLPFSGGGRWRVCVFSSSHIVKLPGGA